MDENPIRTVEMVREIRDRLYEETKDLSREEFRAFILRESAGSDRVNERTRPEGGRTSG